jgi:hypothetical protein
MAGSKWHFSGDVNLEYGGTFIDLSTFMDGYCSAVKLTDLDSACGFTGAVMVEHVVINGTTDRERVRAALRCCGIDFATRSTTRKFSSWSRPGRWNSTDGKRTSDCTTPTCATTSKACIWASEFPQSGANQVPDLPPTRRV